MIKKVMLIFLLFFNIHTALAKEIDINNVKQEIKTFNSWYNDIVKDYVLTSKALAPVILTKDTLYKCQKKYRRMSDKQKNDVEKAKMLQTAIMRTYKEQIVDKKDFELFQKTANNTKLASVKFKHLYKNSQKSLTQDITDDEKELLKLISKQSYAQYISTKYSYKNLKRIAKYNNIALLKEKALTDNFYLITSDYPNIFDDIGNQVNKEDLLRNL